MTLESASDLAQLTAGFPVYFPHGAVELAFVPDRAMATAMFAEVARARRSVVDGAHQTGQTVFEGELSMDGTEPRFRVIQIRQGAHSNARQPNVSETPSAAGEGGARAIGLR